MLKATATRVPPLVGSCSARIAAGESVNTTTTVRRVTWNGPSGKVGRARSASGTGMGCTGSAHQLAHVGRALVDVDHPGHEPAVPGEQVLQQVLHGVADEPERGYGRERA